MTAWLVTAIGGLCVVAVLVDIFHTLANPGRQGFLSRQVHSATWRLSRRSSLAGPVAMLGVIGIWGVVAVLGWTLVYWPHMPDGFVFPDGAAAAHGPNFIDALYLSLVTISTLGFGDVFPEANWLRIANPLEAIFGFALLTVAVSWVLQVYPALSRRRALALRLTALQRAGLLDELPLLEPASAVVLLDGLASAVIGARVDLGDFAETYYFRESDEASALPATLGFALELAHSASMSTHAEVRLAGRILMTALTDFSELLRDRFLPNYESTQDPMASYARDHRHERL